jgi:magnesium chelatase family protein
MTEYPMRISGLLLDRIDIHIEVPRVQYEKLSDSRLGERSSVVQARVEAARQIQHQRFTGTSVACTADMHPAEVRQYCAMDDTCRTLMKTAVQQLQLSARADHWVL